LVFLIWAPSAALRAHTVIIYDLALSGQTQRSGFHGLAGEVQGTASGQKLKIKAKGQLSMGANVTVEDAIEDSCVYILELPKEAASAWDVSIIEGEKLLAGPLHVTVGSTGTGVDWMLGQPGTTEAKVTAPETHGPWNRKVTQAIIAATAARQASITPNPDTNQDLRRPDSFVTLDEGDQQQGRPKRIAVNLDRLEDTLLIACAQKLSLQATADRWLEKLAHPPAERFFLRATNGAPGYEAVDVDINWIGGHLGMRIAKTDAPIQTGLQTTKRNIENYSPWPVSVRAQSRIVIGQDQVYLRYPPGHAQLLAFHQGYFVAIAAYAKDPSLSSPENLTGLLDDILAMLPAGE
jgi:hypothetical protein